jgi:hypothetical protein
LFLFRRTHNASFLCLVAHKALDKPIVTVKKKRINKFWVKKR